MDENKKNIKIEKEEIKEPKCLEDMTEEELIEKIQRGLNDSLNGNVIPFDEAYDIVMKRFKKQ